MSWIRYLKDRPVANSFIAKVILVLSANVQLYLYFCNYKYDTVVAYIKEDSFNRAYADISFPSLIFLLKNLPNPKRKINKSCQVLGHVHAKFARARIRQFNLFTLFVCSYPILCFS